MRSFRILSSILGSFLFMSSFAKPQPDNAELKVVNPLNVQRNDELIVLKRTSISKLFPGVKKEHKFSILLEGRHSIPVQFDDLDKDGLWDEAVFLLDFKPKEKIRLVLIPKESRVQPTVVRAHVRQRRKRSDDTFGPSLDRDSVPAGQMNTDFSKVKLPPFLTEGPAWENDKVGFRIYMDIRNTKDIWGKTTAAMMMDTVGVDPKVIYHHLAPWGMDILAVGQSLGAGSLGISVPKSPGTDTLIRLGGINMGPMNYEKIADGPLRAVFRLHYPKWKILDGFPPSSLIEEISIWGGQYYYQSNVRITNPPPGSRLITGIVNLKSKQSEFLTEQDSKAMYTFDKQSENSDSLGLAISFKNGKAIQFGKTVTGKKDMVSDTYTTSRKTSDQQGLEFRFYAAWERSDKRFKNKAGFTVWLDEELKKYAYPVIVDIFKH